MKTDSRRAKVTRYVDGFVLPVRKDKVDAYRAMAEFAGKIWLEHGALEFVECLADDVKSGAVTSFPQSVHLTEDELVVFSYIVYDSREHRDAVMKKVMDDPRLKEQMSKADMPFDAKRMFFGGFRTIVELPRGDVSGNSA
jgi:uncharacterized protein YbaA (DUF1428 family)